MEQILRAYPSLTEEAIRAALAFAAGAVKAEVVCNIRKKRNDLCGRGEHRPVVRRPIHIRSSRLDEYVYGK
ncbi:MAG TPA: hypothetical protein DCE07_00175 [Peptococcaceae bacterium]|nr:hypothetical protein [Peptococcaceae bacterium]